ncbi:hypothetical protein NA57DRAFT_50337 [Rhizodiscina lignyota]|uniref:Uncharacterized protein n=1 Tax=Rhizodiscina lignyota TaxID=1504668 RepID=A0A9P4M413_9PEZI|nr:hypothetical protein NA57DRAFT_50337 [Rhizodiscina lignyota]
MSADYQGQDPLVLAKQAERDLNSYDAKQGHLSGTKNRNAVSDSANESGVNEYVQNKFPGADVKYGSAASGAGDNREIPVEEGGDINPTTGRPTKARDFEGAGGPEDKARMYAEEAPGNDDVRGGIRQGGERFYDADRVADRR